MTPDEYARFTSLLTSRLTDDDRVAGLVALGSMAAREIAPDRFSDHDFFVIAKPDAAEEMRRDLGWLPDAGAIAFSFRETAHGVKVLYVNGHLAEFAVFAPAELRLAKVNRHRVLLDRGGIAEALEEIRAATVSSVAAAARTDDWLLGQFLTNLLVGAGRWARGERRSGDLFVKAHATGHLLTLLARHVPAADAALLDDLDPFRRFEWVHPALGAELDGALAAPAPAAARALLAIGRRELAHRIRPFPAGGFSAVARALES